MAEVDRIQGVLKESSLGAVCPTARIPQVDFVGDAGVLAIPHRNLMPLPPGKAGQVIEFIAFASQYQGVSVEKVAESFGVPVAFAAACQKHAEFRNLLRTSTDPAAIEAARKALPPLEEEPR